MCRRQTIPRQWLIVHERLGADLWPILRKLPRGSGVLVFHHDLAKGARQQLVRRLRHIGAQRGLVIADDPRKAERVHNLRELRRAAAKRTPLVLLSPLFPTRSHPDWKPLPLMRAATLARIGRRGLVALGGMDECRFRRVQRLGFVGWAGIDAFRT